MRREISVLATAGAFFALLPGVTQATTRDIAELQSARLTFNRSILNQLSYDLYREPFDELQTRPYNLLFSNIGRHPNLSPWQGQEGAYTRYFNALIGNNGTANIDNDADAIQGALIRRETPGFSWGVSGAFLNGNDGGNDSNGTSVFSDVDDLEGWEVRAVAARQFGERRVFGAAVRATQANSQLTDSSFEQGVGGFFGTEDFDQIGLSFEIGMRQFQTSTSSWEIQFAAGAGTAEQHEFSEDLDAGGAVTDRFVITNYEISDLTLALHAGYNRLKAGRLGEMEFRVGVERTDRELDNSDLAYSEDAGGVTPTLTLLGQEPVSSTQLYVSGKSIFQAGETEMFTAAQVGYRLTEGSTEVDAAGTIVNEQIDDSQMEIGLTVGLRQPLFRDRLRFIVSGHADLVDGERSTTFDNSQVTDDSSLSTAQYAVGLEGVLANVTFDIAWLTGNEAPVTPVSLGLPSGSRRSVELDQLVFSAALSW